MLTSLLDLIVDCQQKPKKKKKKKEEEEEEEIKSI